MLLILAILATSMVAPVHEGDIDCGYSVYMSGRVIINAENTSAVVIVTSGGVEIGRETLVCSGDYNILLGYAPAVEEEYSMSCAWIDGTPPYPIDIRTNIVWPDDFTFIYPQKWWVHYEHFLVTSN